MLCRIKTLILSLIVSAVFLSLFAIVFDNSGVKIDDSFGATGAKWNGRQLVSNMKEGFGWFITDYNGYNNKTRPDSIEILFMGDSHFEAIQVMQNQTVSSIVEKTTGLSTYNIGVSGRFLDLSAKSMNYALREYRPSKYIVFDSSNLLISSNRLINSLNPEPASSNVRFSSGIMYYVKFIPFVKPLLYQLQQWKNADIKKDDDKNSVVIVDDEYKCLVSKFLQNIESQARGFGVKPIIVFLSSETINQDGSICFGPEYTAFVEFFANACSDLGILFIDMTSDFQNLYEKNKVLAHGFINTMVGSGHLNKYGHQVLAERISQVIMENQNE